VGPIARTPGRHPGGVRGDTYLERVIDVISLERSSALLPVASVDARSGRGFDAAASTDLAGGFRVRRVTVAATGGLSWSLVGSDRVVVEPVERYLAWLTHIERSPNTVRAYAHDLKLYWSFLAETARGWEAPTVESLGEFVALAASPGSQRRGPGRRRRAAGPTDGESRVERGDRVL